MAGGKVDLLLVGCTGFASEVFVDPVFGCWRPRVIRNTIKTSLKTQNLQWKKKGLHPKNAKRFVQGQDLKAFI